MYKKKIRSNDDLKQQPNVAKKKSSYVFFFIINTEVKVTCALFPRCIPHCPWTTSLGIPTIMELLYKYYGLHVSVIYLES